ncbi:MAG: membrane protease subunit HflK [Hyphomicrobiaceae bacterium]|jgi:membrane protease subunit HflK
MSTGNGGVPPRTPNPEDLVSEIFNRARNNKRVPKIPVGLLVAAAAALWLATGVYQIEPNEVGVVLRFGKTTRTTTPGLHWHLPAPAERVIKVPVASVSKQEVGFRTIDPGPPARYRRIVEESRMLTSDGNIIDLDFIVQYRIQDPLQYLFSIRDPVDTLRDCAESAMREVVGGTDINSTLTEGRSRIQIQAQGLLQEMLDSYDSGLLVTTVKLQDVEPPGPVQDAFKDVIAAEQDRERMINEAEGFANDILPKARGVAAQQLNEARAYAETVVKKAEGEAGRFRLVRAAYSQAPEITRKRMYLETMERILPSSEKIIIDASLAGEVVPLLDLGAVAGQRLRSKQVAP